VPWRFSNAGRQRLSIDPRLPASENLHIGGHSTAGEKIIGRIERGLDFLGYIISVAPG
jgi:hypothetical protein